MSRLKFTLALVTAACVTGPVRTWDVGVVTPTQIKFFSNRIAADIKTEFQLKNMIAVAYDPIKKDLFVSDSVQKVGSIFRIKTAGETVYDDVEPIVARQAATAQGMAFDHLTSTLYWTTGEGQTINFVHVSDNATNVPLAGHVLMRFTEEIPQGIAIDTCKRYLYWTNINHFNATIERSRLDGSDRQVIVHENLFQPLGIAVDMERNLLYWSNEREGTYFSIESSDLNGGARQMLVHGMHQTPFAIALDGVNIYWSDWINNAVWKLPKNSSHGGVSPKLFVKFNMMNTPMGLFSLSDYTTSICALPKVNLLLTYYLNTNGFNSGYADLGVVTPTQIKLFSNGTAADIKTEFRFKNMIAVAYDPIKKDIYVSDSNQKVGSIFRIKITEGTAYNVVEPIVAKQAAPVQGIAFDHLTSTLYWTTGEGQTINFVHVSDNATNVPLAGHVLMRFTEEIPQGIAIDTCKRYLYWTNINHLNATIERSRLDGSDRQVIVHENLFQPLGIAVDMERNLLYWSNEREGTYFSIESNDLNGGARQMLVHGMHQTPFAIALDGVNIYWSDWINNAVWKLPKNSSHGGVSPTMVAKFSLINLPLGLFILSDNTAWICASPNVD